MLLQPLEDNEAPLVFGKAIHAACDTAWKGNSLEQAKEAFLAIMPTDMAGNRTVNVAMAMLDNYYAAWSPRFNDYELLSCEKRLEMTLEGHKFVGVVDKLVWNRVTEALTVVDHKTTSSNLWSFRRHLPLSWQFTGYAALVNHCYSDGMTMGNIDVMVDILGVPKPPRRKNFDVSTWVPGADELEQGQEVFTKNFEQLQEWKQWACSTIDDIAKAEEKSQWRMCPSQCFAYNRECPFMSICEECPGNTSLVEVALKQHAKGLYKKVEPHGTE
jgi:hypothetical protein